MSGKLKVYLETSFISYLTARPSSDPERAERQAFTLKWWEEVAPKCDLFVSDYVYDEVQDGDSEASERRTAEVLKLPFLSADVAEVKMLVDRLREQHQVFEKEVTDAAHIAAASIAKSEIYNDPIVNGVHENRRAILAHHNGDFHAYADSLAARRIPGVRYVAVPAFENCAVKKAS